MEDGVHFYLFFIYFLILYIFVMSDTWYNLIDITTFDGFR
jgi:hypothetical protein